MKKKATTEALPKCWVDKHPAKSERKLYGIWARYNKETKSKIEKECGQRDKKEKEKGAQKKGKGK